MHKDSLRNMHKCHNRRGKSRILAITESLLDSSVSDSESMSNGYTCFRKDPDHTLFAENTYTSERRGGIILLVKQELNPTNHENSDDGAEILWVSLALQPKLEWLVGVYYRAEVDELIMMKKKLWFNTLNRQRKHPTPRWFQFSEHQLSYEESLAGFHRCDTGPFSYAYSRQTSLLQATQRPSHAVRHFHHWGTVVSRVTTEARKSIYTPKGDYEDSTIASVSLNGRNFWVAKA